MLLGVLLGAVPVAQAQLSEANPENDRRDPKAERALGVSARLARMLAVFGLAALLLPSTGSVASWWGGASPSLVTYTLSGLLSGLLLVSLHLVLEQLITQVAKTQSENYLKALHYPLQGWLGFSWPVIHVAYALLNVLGRLGINAAQQSLSDVSETWSRSSQLELDEHERKLLDNVLHFGVRVAREMMVPRPDVVWLSAELTRKQVIERVNDSTHTRFPICEDGPDKVVGYLHAKDLAFLQDAYLPAKIDLKQLARPVAFIPETARAMTLLQRFQSERSHLAVVVDEFGGMAGIVTLEDLLEELVGEIRDEFDIEEAEIQALETGELIVDGGVRLEELVEALPVDFGDPEEDTVGGYIFGRLAREVQIGDQVMVHGATLCVEAVEGLRVTQVRIIPEREIEEVPVHAQKTSTLTREVREHEVSRAALLRPDLRSE